jgi:hypothetical protein
MVYRISKERSRLQKNYKSEDGLDINNKVLNLGRIDYKKVCEEW